MLLPACSPRLIERGPALAKPADLSGHVLLSSVHRPRDWPLWLASAGVTALEAKGAITFDNAALAYQAAIDALGVVIAQRALIEDDLQTGRLIAPFERQTPTPGAYYLAFHPDRPKPPRVAAFEDWLLAEAARSDATS